MTIQPDFRDAGEDFLEHFGKMGMKWGRRNPSNYESVMTVPSSQSYDSPSYVEVTTNKRGMSTNGKIATAAILGVVGVGLVLAMSPGARKVGMSFVNGHKNNMGGVKINTLPKVTESVKYAGFRDLPKAPGFKSSSRMKSAGKTWAKRLFDMTQTRDTLADMQSRIPKTKTPATGVFNLIDFMPKVMSTDLAVIR